MKKKLRKKYQLGSLELIDFLKNGDSIVEHLKKVCVLGLGYIGLPTAALIASKKISVLGVDVKDEVVKTINSGQIHIVEPDLGGLVKYDIENSYLSAQKAPEASDVFIISVPTPFSSDHSPDISFVQSAVQSVIPVLSEGNLVILESTSPVGTTEKMASFIFEKRPELKDKLYIAYCPERVLPGHVLYELEHNDRVIGGIDQQSTEKAKAFYRLFVTGELHETHSSTAEMCKLVENAYRDVNIAFANELSIMADKAKVNVNELINLANKHPRVNILQPGPGVGGHCIAVDPWFLISQFPKETPLIKIARELNSYKSLWVIEQIENTINQYEKKFNKKPVVALLGLSYKPDIDDLRESPALFIAQTLGQKHSIRVNEPHVNKEFIADIPNSDFPEILDESDIVVKLVNHRLYQDYDFSKQNEFFLDFT